MLAQRNIAGGSSAAGAVPEGSAAVPGPFGSPAPLQPPAAGSGRQPFGAPTSAPAFGAAAATAASIPARASGAQLLAAPMQASLQEHGLQDAMQHADACCGHATCLLHVHCVTTSALRVNFLPQSLCLDCEPGAAAALAQRLQQPSAGHPQQIQQLLQGGALEIQS